MGESITNIAQKIRAARQTVSEWVNHNERFQLTLEARRGEAWHGNIDPLRSLVPRAIDALEAALTGRIRLSNGNASLASSFRQSGGVW